MDLQEFRRLVDSTEVEIDQYSNDLEKLYQYAGIAPQGVYQLETVGSALYERIRAAFVAGHSKARSKSADLVTDLIREHVILDAKLDPYLEILIRLRDALNSVQSEQGDIGGDWATAIKAARDHLTVSSWRASAPERLYARQYEVAKAARALKDTGYSIRLEPGFISLEEPAEAALVKEIESLTQMMGGLNVARRLFKAISPLYDAKMKRYHIVPSVSMSGGGKPQEPWGYLLQLAVKHFSGSKPYIDTDRNWQKLVALATAYAAIIDVQPYVPAVFGSFEPHGLLKHVQETALFDTVFRFPQLRTSDTARLCAGLLGFRISDQKTPDGWTLDQALEVIDALFSCTADVRGPVTVKTSDICRCLPNVPKKIVVHILETVFSHPLTGANRHFSRPTDAPTSANPEHGLDFFLKPLLPLPSGRFVMIDRSVCAAAFPEALLTAFRPLEKGLEDKVGLQAERFLEAEFTKHGVPVQCGDYDVGPEHGECDIVIETAERVVFLELKKKALTRKAKAGNDAYLLLDLAGSLLAAQAQAGWHEVRLQKAGSLALYRNGQTYDLTLNDRHVERVAVALLDYGSFQDRNFLKHMLEATLSAAFTPADTSLSKRFADINQSLQEIREQLAELHPGKAEIPQPFFHCWFLSVPQILVLLEDVADAQGFWRELTRTRHVLMGTSDFYYEYSKMKQWAS